MGGYSFGYYKEPCPNCGGQVKYFWFAGDHYDTPSSSIYCENTERCGATFIRDQWEKYNEEKHGKKFLVTTARG